MTYHDRVTNFERLGNELRALTARIVMALMLLICAQPAIGATAGIRRHCCRTADPSRTTVSTC